MPLRPDRSATGAVGRRAVVSGLAGASVLALAGCDSDTSGNNLPGGSGAAQDADSVLVRDALNASLAATAQLGPLATGTLRTRLAPLIAMHRAHVDTLSAAAPESGSPSPSASATVVPTSPGVAGARRVEKEAHDRLVALAQRAQSGQLARLLASMAAGISQRLVELR